MTLKELKEIVRQLIGRARTKDAIDKIIKWAKENDQEQLGDDSILLKNAFEKLNREKRLGLLSNSEANIEQNKITNGVLSLLNDVNENNPISSDPMPSRSVSNDPIPGNPSGNSQSAKMKILMLTANPANTTKLNLDKEHSIITQKLQQKQEHFNIIRKKAVTGMEFQEFTDNEKPDILHFSGHGAKYDGIVVQNEDKNGEDLISTKGLKALFKFFKKHCAINVVLLNACHTQEQAAAISEYVEYVIGTNIAIGDDVASSFSSGFYFKLANDDKMNIEDAFDSGRTAAIVKGADEENFIIYRNGKLINIE